MKVEELGEGMRDDHWWNLGRRIKRLGEQGSHRCVQSPVSVNDRKLLLQPGQRLRDLVLTGGITDSFPQDHVFVSAELEQMCQGYKRLGFNGDDCEERSETIGWRVELCHARSAGALIARLSLWDDAHVAIIG